MVETDTFLSLSLLRFLLASKFSFRDYFVRVLIGFIKVQVLGALFTSWSPHSREGEKRRHSLRNYDA